MTGRCAHTHTDRQTDRQTNTNERIISAIHFVHLAEITTTMFMVLSS